MKAFVFFKADNLIEADQHGFLKAIFIDLEEQKG